VADWPLNMTRPSRVLAAAASLFASFALACTGKKADHAPAKTGLKRVLVGATLPLSGAEARSAAMFKQGYDLAIEEVNRRGGLVLNGATVPVELIVRDDGTQVDQVTALTRKLIDEDKVDFLLGTYTSALIAAGGAVAEEAHVPYVNGAGGVVDLYKRNFRYLFGVQPPVEQISTSFMLWLSSVQKTGRLPSPARIALLWENDGYGKSFRKGLTDFVARTDQAGAWELVTDEPFDLGAKSFSSQLGKVKAARADVFLAGVHQAEFLELHQEYLKSGLCHKVESYGTRGLARQSGEAFGAHGVDHLLVTSFWNPHVGNKALLKTFLDAYQQKYGEQPDWYQAISYETARALLTAIEHAGSVDRDAVRDRLASLRMPSIMPSGLLSFPAEYGQQARFLLIVAQNQPDGSAGIVYPTIAATTPGEVPNPRCEKPARAGR
jgi:branched-chain amino acid transport system substrate-binding protein